jgi:hypothetical protein
VGDLAKRLGEGHDACACIANGHDANLAQLHSSVGLSSPALSNPHGVFARLTIRLILIKTVETAKRGGVLVFHLSAMPAE